MHPRISTISALEDLHDRPGIERLVNRFYDKVRGDDLLGFIFKDIAKTNWDTHLPKMYMFWEAVVFGTARFSGNPIAAHAKLTGMTAMGRVQFDRWLQVFTGTVDELFLGPKADHIKRCAADMANVIHARINGVQQDRFDPAKLTPEQSARYAAYRANAEREVASPSS